LSSAIVRGIVEGKRKSAMTTAAKEILATALLLSVEDRNAIAEELLTSVEPLSEADADELLIELDRRAEELRSDPTQALPWETVRDLR
jgi:putative addiction module component (TIGR02574 family)